MLGFLIIQKKIQFSNWELVKQITENPYLQYFIGLRSNQYEPPFDPNTLVLFWKRLDEDAIMDTNAYMFDNQRMTKIHLHQVYLRKSHPLLRIRKIPG